MTVSSAPTGSEPELRAVAIDGHAAPIAVVLGGTGYVGGRLVPRLITAGYRVRVLARSVDRVLAYDWGGAVEIVVGDVADPVAVTEAVTDAAVVYYLVHSMTTGKGFEDADRRAAEVVARAARRMGVGRLVYLGGLHPDGVELSPHLRSRVEVGEILMGSGVPTLVFQAGVVIGSGSASFEMIRHLTEVLPYMPAPRWVRNHIQPIAVRDVLYYLLAAARVDPSVNRAFDIGGPDVYRYGQMMNAYALEAGLRQRPIASLPVLTPKLASHWVNLVTPIPRSLARPLVESLQNECVMKDHDIDAVIPPPPGGLTGYRKAVRLALRVQLEQRVETSWVDGDVVGAPSSPLPADPEWAGRTVFTDARSVTTGAPADRLWTVIEGIGGRRGWYSWPLAWAVRGLMDKAMGGVGLRRGRRDPDRLILGDAVDFWRVEAIERGGDSAASTLLLRAEMKVPGLAWLELKAVPLDGGSRYEQRAIFFPKGLAGRLYWLAVLPFHGLIFASMAARITAAASRGPARSLDGWSRTSNGGPFAEP